MYLDKYNNFSYIYNRNLKKCYEKDLNTCCTDTVNHQYQRTKTRLNEEH